MKKLIAIFTMILTAIPVFAEPKYSFYLERRDKQGHEYMFSRTVMTTL